MALLRDNERIWSGFRDIELEILSAASLPEILDVIRHRLPQQFPAITQAALVWLDPDNEVTRLVTEHGASGHAAFLPLRALVDDHALPATRRPWLGQPDASLRALLLADFPGPIGSVAVAPLWLRGARTGFLVQASDDQNHYTPDAATDLLEHLAAVTALCVDNAINRVQLQRDGLTDSLTQIANRRFFERRLREEVSLWQRHGGNLSCLIVDIDHFKNINDNHGHLLGDQVLVQTARVLNAGLRTSDVLARYGGEEFVLLLPATDGRRAAEIAERLRKAVSRPQDDKRLPAVTVSVGVATFDEGLRAEFVIPGQIVLQAADAALYRAKAQGRNRVVVLSRDEVRQLAAKTETEK